MGGLGTGRHNWYKKRTVEECFALCIDTLVRAGLLNHRRGNIEWTDYDTGRINSIHYLLKPSDVPHYLYLYLFFCVRCNGNWEDVCESVTLVARPQRLGGVRYYFHCPRWCGRLVRKIYWQPEMRVFGCRACCGLTYQSAQEHDRRMDVFRRNPEVLPAALEAGSFLAANFVLRNLFRLQPKNVVTITQNRT